MPDTIARITPESVLAARAALPQYGVARGHFCCIYQNRECFCGMSLVAIHKGMLSARAIFGGGSLMEIARAIGVSGRYARSFMYGFDDCEAPVNFDDQGYSDGRECAKALGFTSSDIKFAD